MFFWGGLTFVLDSSIYNTVEIHVNKHLQLQQQMCLYSLYQYAARTATKVPVRQSFKEVFAEGLEVPEGLVDT